MNTIEFLNLQELTPASDFKNGQAYTSVSVREIMDGKVSDRIEVINSARKHFTLTNENLLSSGFYTERQSFPNHRWSRESIQSFLKGTSSPDIREIFADIKEQFRNYVDFPDESYYSLCSAWIMGTYFHRLFSAYPYLHFQGSIASGKTKTLTLISLLSFNAELTFNSTQAYIIRAIHNNHSTICIDEAENLKGNGMLISMLNAGYKKGIYTGKVEKEDGAFKPKLFEGYSPKVFASIGTIRKSLASRCIKIQMQQSKNSAIENREIDMNSPVFQEIRDKLYLLMLTKHEEIKREYQQITEEEIKARDWELWKPVFAMAKVIDNEKNVLYSTLKKLAMERGVEKEDKGEQFRLEINELIKKYPSQSGFYATSKIMGFLRLNPVFKNINGKALSNYLKTISSTIEPIQKKINGKPVRGYYLKPEIFGNR
jgi:hypothetical protein